MTNVTATRLGKPGGGYNRDFSNNEAIKSKYPAYGKQLAERMRFKNPPILVIIEVGNFKRDIWPIYSEANNLKRQRGRPSKNIK